jgi:hypothetical protein
MGPTQFLNYPNNRYGIARTTHQNSCLYQNDENPRHNSSLSTCLGDYYASNWLQHDTVHLWTGLFHNCNIDDFQISRFNFPKNTGCSRVLYE